MTDARHLFCYIEQYYAIRVWLDAIGAITDNVKPVNHYTHLYGRDHITFLVVKDHPKRVPDDMMAILRAWPNVVIIESDFHPDTQSVEIVHAVGPDRHSSEKSERL